MGIDFDDISRRAAKLHEGFLRIANPAIHRRLAETKWEKHQLWLSTVSDKEIYDSTLTFDEFYASQQLKNRRNNGQHSHQAR